MYDTVWFYQNNVNGKDLSPYKLIGESIDPKRRTFETISWKIGTMDFRLNQQGQWVRGSQRTFYKGDNIYSYKQDEMRTIVDRLSDLSKINFLNLRITRLDCAVDLEMQLPIIEYLNLLGIGKRFGPAEFADGQTIYYRNGVREIAFYDKVAQIKPALKRR